MTKIYSSMYNGYVLAVDVCVAVNEPILPPWEQLEIGNLLSQQPAIFSSLGWDAKQWGMPAEEFTLCLCPDICKYYFDKQF